MQLSEDRIRVLSKRLAKELITGRVIATKAGAADLADFIGKVLMVDQAREAEIEAEARAFLARQKSLPPPGTGEYQAAFQQAKRVIATRKGFVL